MKETPRNIANFISRAEVMGVCFLAAGLFLFSYFYPPEALPPTHAVTSPGQQSATVTAAPYRVQTTDCNGGSYVNGNLSIRYDGELRKSGILLDPTTVVRPGDQLDLTIYANASYFLNGGGNWYWDTPQGEWIPFDGQPMYNRGVPKYNELCLQPVDSTGIPLSPHVWSHGENIFVCTAPLVQTPPITLNPNGMTCDSLATTDVSPGIKKFSTSCTITAAGPSAQLAANIPGVYFGHLTNISVSPAGFCSGGNACFFWNPFPDYCEDRRDITDPWVTEDCTYYQQHGMPELCILNSKSIGGANLSWSVDVATTPQNPPPIGFHDSSTCTASFGWACDASDYNQPLQIHFYGDGPAGVGAFLGAATANIAAEPGVASQCGGNANHRFQFSTPDSLKNGANHDIYAYALDIPSGAENRLTGSPKTINCQPPAGDPTVTCVADPPAITAGQSTTWRATASEGSGAYTKFSWSDDKGNSRADNGSPNPNSWGPISYSADATATVTVTDSNNKSGTNSCNVAVSPQPPVTISGRVFNETTGQGFGGATIETCRGFQVSTDANGNFSFPVPQKEGFCARVSPETRAGLDGPFLNNNAGLEFAKTYEWQVAGWHCASQGGCNADQNTWDRNTDGTYDFKYRSSPLPRYSCSGAGGSCVSDPNGPYTTSNCDHACILPPSTGDLRVKRVGSDLLTTSIPATTARVVTVGESTLNPADFTGLNVQAYTVQATDLAGYDETYNTCTYARGGSECLVTSFPSTPACSGGWCSAGSQSVSADTVTKVVFKYAAEVAVNPPAASPACTGDSVSRVTISWDAGVPGSGFDPSSGYWVDIDFDNNWNNGFWNKGPIPQGTTSTDAPAGFAGLTLTPGNTYQVRVFYIASGSHSPTGSFTAPNCAAATGDLRVKRVGSDLLTTSIPATTAEVVGVGQSAANPAFFNDLNVGSYAVRATDLAGYTETYGTCTYARGGSECTVTTFPNAASCDNTWCSAPGQVVSAETVTKVVFKYVVEQVNAPVCSPSPVTLGINQSREFSVSNGIAPYSWKAPGATPPTTGTGATFSASYGSTGTYKVTVTDGNTQQSVCNVSVESGDYIINSVTPQCVGTDSQMKVAVSLISGTGFGINLYRCQNAGCDPLSGTKIYGPGSGNVTVTDPGRTPNKTYRYQAQAVDSGHLSNIGQAKAISCSAYTLAVNSSGASGVGITSTTGHGGTTNYSKSGIPSGTSVVLTAPDPATPSGPVFSSWTGCNSVTGTYACNATITANRTVTANYVVPPPPPTCSPDPASVAINAPTKLTAGGGNGTYSWNTGGGSPATGTANPLSNVTYATVGTKTVTVTSAGKNGTCQVTVTPPIVSTPQCSDGVDNSDPEDAADPKWDYCGQGGNLNSNTCDVGCASPTDNDERNRCVDGIDNDGDGKVDFDATSWTGPGPWPGKDPGCTSQDDNTEANPPTFEEIPPSP